MSNHHSSGTFSAKPAAASATPLDDRACVLLKTLVESYIAEGAPVGSRALSRVSGLDLSAATVRNVMADLEDLGFIASPHTSAGRIPTPRGYRFFVDSLLTMQPLEQIDQARKIGHRHITTPGKRLACGNGRVKTFRQTGR